MCYFIRTTLLIIFSHILTGSFAQLTIDPAVKNQYDSANKKLPVDLRKNIEQLQNESLKRYNSLSPEDKKHFPYTPSYEAVVTRHTIDTLNKDQLQSGAFSYKTEKYQTLFCEGNLVSDSLVIVLYPGVAQNSSIHIAHLVTHNKVETKYIQWVKYDSSFRINLQEEKTNELILPVTTTRFVLSDTNFIVGKTLFGYADCISEPYYEDNTSFKTGYIARRLYFRYYFKLIITKGNDEE